MVGTIIPWHKKLVTELVLFKCLCSWEEFSLTSCSLHLFVQTYFFTDESPLQNYSEPEETFLSTYRKFIEEREKKEPEIPENINMEKISLETLLQVFRAQNKAQNANRFAHHLRAENAYLEVGKGSNLCLRKVAPSRSIFLWNLLTLFNICRIIRLTNFTFLKNFIKVFEDLGAKNLEPIEVSVLLKHPFIQDLISSYPGYRIPVSITQRHPHSAELRLERSGTFRCGLAGSGEKLDSARQGLGKLSWEWHLAK